MTVFKCKMCGGNLMIQDGSSICECESCGSTQTIPILNDEKKKNLFNRANRLRFNSEFDAAASVYMSITAEYPKEAEAYWGLCLCKFGIEYIDDPLTGKKIPTCHRTLTYSILDDDDYIQALEYADADAKRLYSSEANQIDKIQQGILKIANSESPYDVFICYKESDANGERTEDSTIAYDIYDSLTEKGLKVFFAHITLENKLGQEYEPYIFAALHSAKVMIVIGTRIDYFEAVWVKNEWSRFLDMMRTDRKKILIPCFKHMDITEIPKEFQRLQAQNLEKLGWLQTLTHGILKICEKEDIRKKPAAYNNKINAKLTDHEYENRLLFDRIKIYIDDGYWSDAEKYCRQYIETVPNDSEAHWMMLLIENKVKNDEQLIKKGRIISDNSNYKKAVQYADDEGKEKYESINDEIISEIRKNYQFILEDIKNKINNAQNHNAFDTAFNKLSALYEFPEVKEMKIYCLNREEEYFESRYKEANKHINNGKYEEAINILKEISTYKDSAKLSSDCQDEINKQKRYQEALSLKDNKEWNAAEQIFAQLGNYKDSVKQAKRCKRKGMVIKKTTFTHKIFVILHCLLNVFIMITGISKYVGSNSLVSGLTLIELIIIPILTCVFDRRKTTKHVILLFGIALIMVVVLASIITNNYGMLADVIISQAIVALLIVL